MQTNFDAKDLINGSELYESFVSIDDVLRKVVINNLMVDSPELFELLRKFDTVIDRIAETKKVIDIGAFVKSKVQMAVDTDYFDKRVSDMTVEFEKGLETVKSDLLATIAQKFDPSKSDSYTDKIQKFFDETKAEFAKQIQDSLLELSNGKKAICDKINASFDPDLKTSHISRFMESVDKLHITIRNDFDLNKAGSITHQMKELIKETLGENGELAKSIDHRLSFDNPNSTIAILQQNLVKKLDEIKTELAASRSAVEAEKAALEKSTQKGLSFEDVLLERLEILTRQHSAVVEKTARRVGEIQNCTKGDFVITLPAIQKRIVVEAKNGSLTSLPKLINEMSQSKVNRNADYVICIYADEVQLNTQVGIFQEYPPDKIVTYSGLSEVALKMAISRLIMTTEIVEGIDKAAVEKEIDAIKFSLKSLSSIKSAANNILKQANTILSKADETKSEICCSLEALSELLCASDENLN